MTGVKPGENEWLRSASKRRRYLVGVSGGADSVALLHLLAGAGFRRLVVCHLDHGLRGRASRGDARFVKRLAERLELPFEGGRAEVAADAGSLETAARRARHRFFADCARRWRCGRLLLAHHADDQAETVLWNLLRGSRGASGMAEIQTLSMAGREIEVIRPLLATRSRELRDWLRAKRLRWREDATNAAGFTVRNRLRHEVMPLLGEAAGRDVTETLNRAADSAAELREIEAWAVREAGAVDPQGRLHVPKLRSLPPALRAACVHDFLKTSGVPDLDRATVSRVLAMLDPASGATRSLPGGRRMRRRQGRMWVE